MSMYHEGHRELQDRYKGRAVADRLEQHRMHRTVTDTDREFIVSGGRSLGQACIDELSCQTRPLVPVPEFQLIQITKGQQSIQQIAAIGRRYREFVEVFEDVKSETVKAH